MIRSVNVPLDEAAFRALGQLADREFRNARLQAAALVVDGLRREGVLAAATRQELRTQNGRGANADAEPAR